MPANWPTPLPDSGYIPDVFDPRDRQYQYQSILPPIAMKVNLWDKNKPWLERVYSQHGAGSCVANATAAAVRYLAHKTAHSNLAEDPSRLFIYYNARALGVIDPDKPETKHWPLSVKDDGTDIRNAMKAIGSFGIAPESAWPYEMQDRKSVV